MDANLKEALENVSKALYTMSSVSAEASVLVEKIKGSIVPSVEELPSMVSVVSEEPACDICGDLPEWVEMDKERGICMTCAGHLDEGIKYYTEDFAFASIHGNDALRLLVLRQRADNCRDLIAAAAASYDGDLEAHEASVEEKMLNKRAAECLGRLPASFAPWWKDTWTHEKWCEMGQAQDAAGWPVEKGALIVQRLAAMFVAEQNKVHKLKAKHAEVLANIERAREEDMEAVEKRHEREMARLRDQLHAAEAGCEKKCHDANRRGYAMGYAFADEKATKAFEAMRADLERLSAENKGLRQQIEEDKQMVQRHLKEIAKEHAQMTAWEKKEIERLTEENKSLERRVAEESHWCKHTNMAARTAEMHAQMLRTDVAQLQMENEGLKKQLVTKEDMVTPRLKLLQKMVDDLSSPPLVPDLQRLTAENKELREQIEEDKQMVQRHLKEIAKEHAKMTAWEKKEIERLTEENVHELKKAHAEVLANIERARKEDMEAVEARHQHEMAELQELQGEVEAASWQVARAEAAAGMVTRRAETTETRCKQLQDDMDAATKAYQAMRSDLERLSTENKGLLQQIEEDKQMVQRHLKEITKEQAKMTAWEKKEIERLTEENKMLERRVAEESRFSTQALRLDHETAEMRAEQLRTDVVELKKENEALLDLVEPTIKLVKSNPELFGGEALPSGGASPRPPAIIRIKEEGKQGALNFLRSMLTPSRPCLLVESTSTVLPGIVEAEASSSQTEGLCAALTQEQYQQMMKTEGAPPLPPSPPDSPLLVPDQPAACGAGGCIDCLLAEPLAEPVAKPVAKPKPNYNHPNWPSPKTKRFAKHLAKHSGLRSPWLSQDPKAIKTHQDALEYIAKRSNISVETLLQWTMSHYQSFSEPWTLVKGSSHYFDMGTTSAKRWF
jgi:hypothetical protein